MCVQMGSGWDSTLPPLTIIALLQVVSDTILKNKTSRIWNLHPLQYNLLVLL